MAAFSSVNLLDERFEVPANDWRYVDPVTRGPALVDCAFQADTPDAQVRLVLLTQEDLNGWRLGRNHDEIAATPVGPRGVLRVPLYDPDAYIVIENRGSQPAGGRLRVFLEQPNVRYLPRSRRLAVILISFTAFFAIVTFSARRLLKAIGR